MNILIMGDSWAADWSKKYTEYAGWPELLADQHSVTNVAQAGVCQYSICKQFADVNPENFDRVIISITSPYRVYTPVHPVHHSDPLHSASDLIYTDLEHHVNTGNQNTRLLSAVKYFEHHFDTEQAEFSHKLYTDWCLSRLNPDTTIVTSLILNNDPDTEHQYIDGHGVWLAYPGKINHLSAEGNEVFVSNIARVLT
jgi:hypothetical protein